MARPRRISFSGALYHVTCRGNAREAIYWDDSDRELFLKLLVQVIDRYRFLCYGYCLMDNHYHLLIKGERVPFLKVPCSGAETIRG